ncbi:MAG TPA: hypothetical protein VFK78_04485 [Gemmatimonadales bacterium]|nr:hypothetical protein [Gemmatimonadales bacterium]
MRPMTVLMIAGALAAPRAPAQVTLSNGKIRARFGTRGLLALDDAPLRASYRFTSDGFALALAASHIESDSLPAPRLRSDKSHVVYTWTAGRYRLEVAYELRADWGFLSKEVRVVGAPPGAFRVSDVTVFQSTLAEAPTDVYVPKSSRPSLGTGAYGAALRFPDGRGLLAVAQNPFLQFTDAGASFTLHYQPDMDWDPATGPFVADRGLLAPYRLSGTRLPERMLPEWKLPAPPAAPGMDQAEVETFTALVRAFLIDPPEHPNDVFVGWCVNDYQIDVATPDGRAEYQRVMDRAAQLGARYVLFAPTNSALSRREESVDYWSWEHVLWLGLGQKIRKGEWNPDSSAIPPSVQAMLDYARGKDLKLLAYVYPVLPFRGDSSWLVRPANDSTRRFANLGVRSFQDWLIATLVSFHRRTGIGGYAFDHTFLDFPGRSRYAQWWGWRRVLEELKRQIPDLVVDGRQAYQLYGPWSWLAGSYPHPTSTDEQPESFVPFPDLHFDRVSADRERYTAYRYREYEFAPSEIVPGFITHQTSRGDDKGEMPDTVTPDRGLILKRFRARDWDYLGWKYSLLSSIAVAGWNNVLNMIPARDSEENAHFSAEDAQFFRHWIAWTDSNRTFLRDTRPILGQPALGQVDGWAAMAGDRGYLFFFNPNGRAQDLAISLDSVLGLRGAGHVLRELYPLAGRLIGWGERGHVTLHLDGGSARVLALEPLPGAAGNPILFNAPGGATVDGGNLSLIGVRGEVGTSESLLVVVPDARPISTVTVNGRRAPFVQDHFEVRIPVTFAGAPFHHYQEIGGYDSTFAGGTFLASFTVPRRIFDQLAARARAWPIPWTAEDYRTTWLAPERLLLFVQIAEPDDRWAARLWIDGRPIELRKAYSAVRAEPRTFVGFYADLSLLEPDREYRLRLELPPLRPGQLQGVFFENVEPEYTEEIAP